MRQLNRLPFCLLFIFYAAFDTACLSTRAFAMTIRGGYTDKVYIMTSGEMMSLYAAVNISHAVKSLGKQGISYKCWLDKISPILNKKEKPLFRSLGRITPLEPCMGHWNPCCGPCPQAIWSRVEPGYSCLTPPVSRDISGCVRAVKAQDEGQTKKAYAARIFLVR